MVSALGGVFPPPLQNELRLKEKGQEGAIEFFLPLLFGFCFTMGLFSAHSFYIPAQAATYMLPNYWGGSEVKVMDFF